MIITTPAKQVRTKCDLYYVESESHPGDKSHQHLVIHAHEVGVFFCDCKDFMARQMPDAIENEEKPICKHGEYVSEVLQIIPDGHRLVSHDGVLTIITETGAKYGVFVRYRHDGTVVRSTDISGSFDSFQDAQDALDKFNRMYGRPTANRFVAQLEGK